VFAAVEREPIVTAFVLGELRNWAHCPTVAAVLLRHPIGTE
jgi:hypothetical protein